MAEVVSVSEPSPLEVVRPGLGVLVFSEADEGWSGTGIAPAMQEDVSVQSDAVIANRQQLPGDTKQYTVKTEVRKCRESTCRNGRKGKHTEEGFLLQPPQTNPRIHYQLCVLSLTEMEEEMTRRKREVRE